MSHALCTKTSWEQERLETRAPCAERAPRPAIQGNLGRLPAARSSFTLTASLRAVYCSTT